MLSSFIRRGARRKGTKVNDPQKTRSTSPSPSPVVFNINDQSSTRLVELDFSNHNEDWFPQELLHRSISSRSPPRLSQDTLTQDDLTEDANAIAFFNPSPRLSTAASPVRAIHLDHPFGTPDSSSHSKSPASRKKSIPAPIFIPDVHLIPHVHLHSTKTLPQIPNPIANDTPSRLPSPSVSDDLSAISGTTLARALIASAFVLSPSERRSSRHRSGITRQDSATLPRRDSFFLSESGRASPVPPVPPVPSQLTRVSLSPNNPKSGKSTESEYPMSDSYVTSPEAAIGALIPRRISRIQKIPSSTASLSSPSSTPDISLRRKDSGQARPRAFTRALFDVPKTAFPINSRETTRYSSQDGSFLLTSDDHSLDEFDFLPPESIVVASPDSYSNASHIGPLPNRGDAHRGQRKCRVVELNLVRKDSKSDSSADGILVSHQSYALPSTTGSEHDYGELLNYDLTVSPGTSSSGYQTFPETPMIFSPLFSPNYTLLSRSDSQVLRKVPSTPKSARLAPGKLHSNVKALRRQLSINERPGNVVLLCRCQSSLSPIQRTPSPKSAKLGVPPSKPTNNEAGFSDEANQTSTTRQVESQISVEQPSPVRPHPLSHISSSSSCLPEEEALQALAPHSASSLPSVTVGDVDALTKPTIVSSHVESLAAVPLPESTDVSPFTSPALTDDAPATSSLTSPLQTSLPTTTTTTSQSARSTYPLSSSLGGSSFLPSPSPPSSRQLSPVPILSSAVLSDDLGSHSPSPSFVPPPPYYTVVSERTAHHLGSSSVQTPSDEPGYQHSRQASNSSLGSVRTRMRARPPLPFGPRKPGGPGQGDSFVSGVRHRRRNSSVFSLSSFDMTGNQGALWRTLQSAVSKPPPKFHSPPPKWRGLTLEAAEWTFSSAQLQEVVSRAIQQASEGSSLRLLKLEVLEGEIADETHRLELQHTDVKAQYKALVRKRWALMGALARHIEGVETNDSAMAARTMEELTEVLLALDQLADKMHNIALQLAQLKSLRDVHNASALAMVVRKINGLFVRKMAEKERLQEQVDVLQTERDEAWKHAEDIAEDYDTFNDRVLESMGACVDAGTSVDPQFLAGNSSKRSTRISAVRKSSIRQSEAGLRRSSKRRSTRPSGTYTRPASLTLADGVPPVPRLPSVESATLPILTGTAPSLSPISGAHSSIYTLTGLSFGALHSNNSATSEAMALANAQYEVYEMLGLNTPPSQASSRLRVASGTQHQWSGNSGLRPPSSSFAASSRPVSASFGVGTTGGGSGKRMQWSREEWRKAIKSVGLDGAHIRRHLSVPPLKVAVHG